MADDNAPDIKSTEQVSVTPPNLRNPTGKGGFGDNPQNRNPGGWDKENTISYQYNRFLRVNPEELAGVIQKDKDAGSWTIAKDLAYRRIQAATKSLPDVKEITDRTEGKPQQYIEQNISGEINTGDVDPKLAAEFAEFLKGKK